MSFEDIFNKYIDEFDKELSWRKKELNDLKNELKQLQDDKKDEEFDFFKRGTIALTYAHLEGGVKNFFIIYLNFINGLIGNELISLKKNNIDEIILDLLFYDKVKVFTQNTREKRLKGLKYCERFFRDFNSVKINISIIDTKSNLNFKVLERLYNLINLDIPNNIRLKEKFFNILLERRNAIAHGENISDKTDIVIDNIDKVLEILEIIKNDLKTKMENFKEIM